MPIGAMQIGAGATIAVVGGGLASGLVALALARRGASVLQLAGPAAGQAERAGLPLQAVATALSYGALQGRGPCRQWQWLERLHGPLGFRPSPLMLHGLPAPLALLPPWSLALGSRALAVARVDPPQLLAALPAALAAAGVEQRWGVVQQLQPLAGGGWQLQLQNCCEASSSQNFQPVQPVQPVQQFQQVVLAAGAGCRELWPALPERLGVSWAGVLSLPRNPGGCRWLDLVGRGWIVQAYRWQRPLLEARAASLSAAEWIVDPGLAPAGEGVVLGQISLVRPGGAAGAPPDAALMEARLRQGLARLDPALARLEAPYRQVPVSFCSNGQPLAGPLAGAEGLWALCGFSGAFALLPAAAEQLAARVVAAAS
ncbi:MAG: FAD-dependent oxidoreductase [Prochlorococcaceae cyanobacterium]